MLGPGSVGGLLRLLSPPKATVGKCVCWSGGVNTTLTISSALTVCPVPRGLLMQCSQSVNLNTQRLGGTESSWRGGQAARRGHTSMRTHPAYLLFTYINLRGPSQLPPRQEEPSPPPCSPVVCRWKGSEALSKLHSLRPSWR